MQHIASPLQPEPAVDTPQAVIQDPQALLSSSAASNEDARTHTPLLEKHQQGQHRHEGPDLSGAIERVLAWHRARGRHH